MANVISSDGSTIAYQVTGSGPTLICVPAALNLRGAFDDLAAELSTDHTVVQYDRRGRGDSTDAIDPGEVATYRIERELEDLAAVHAAVGGDATLFGYSSGAQLALTAATGGAHTAAVIYEPPFQPDRSQVRTDLVDTLIELVATGRPGDALATFQIDGIGMPAELVQQMRQAPMWPALEEIAQTVVYDATLTADPRPTAAVQGLTVPVLSLAGADTWPMLIDGARFAAEQIQGAEYVQVAGGANHQFDAAEVAAAIRGWQPIAG